MVVNVFLAILILIRFVTGLRLLISGRMNHLPNLIWLSVSMFVTVIILLFAPVEGNPLANLPISLWIFTVGSFLGQASLIIFNQLTFYKDRKSPVVWIWAIFILCSGLATYGVFVSESNFKQSPWVAASSPVAAIIWIWHGWLAYQALNRLASEQSVEDWIKTRYRLIIAYSIVLTIGAIASIIRNFFAGGALQSSLGSLMATISLITQIVSITLLFLVWVMPEGFRQWLNRNQQARSEEQIHGQAQAILNIVGSAMCEDTRLTKITTIYALRKAIGQEINTEDSKKIEAHMVNMGYDAWSAFLDSPKLSTLIQNSLPAASPRDVIKKGKHALVEKQSLFTLQAK